MLKMDEIREWVNGVLEQGADRIELRAKHDDARVRQWLVAEGSSTDKAESDKLADQIAREAARDGACQSGATVVYVVFAFRGDTDGYLARLLVQVEGRPRKAGGGVREDDHVESANLQGVLAMMMKENGELHRLLIMSQEGRAEADARSIDRLLEQLNQHEMKRAAMLEMYEKLQSMQMERERERAEMKLAEERQKYIGGKLEMIVPVLMNRLLGGGPGKGTPFFGEEMVRQIMGNIKPQEVDAFMRSAAMRPEMQALFTELYLSYWNKEQAHKAAEEEHSAEAAGAEGEQAS